MQGPIAIFTFLIFIFSVIVHEVAHGIAAEREGDPTARVLGRITLNPLKHIDLFGSIILPLILYISQAGFIIGWAKPVPYNPDNLRHGNRSVAKVSIAGIVVNLVIALVFGLLTRGLIMTGTPIAEFTEITGRYYLVTMIVFINLVLALFNAVPIAPLDGFRFFSAILPSRMAPVFRFIETYSLPILLVFIVFGWKFVAPLAYKLYALITVVGL